MEEICRLCLSSNSPSFLHYLSSTLTQKIEAVLPVQVIENDFLPNNVCSACTEKINEMHDFQLKVATNQNLLHRYLSEGIRNLNEFYSTLKNNLLKLETENGGQTSTESKNDTLKLVKKEEKDGKSNEEQVSHKEEKLDKCNEVPVIYTNIPIENDQLTKQKTFGNDDDFHSDDNIPLSSEYTAKKTKVPAKRNKKNIPTTRNTEKVPKVTKRKKGKVAAKTKKEKVPAKRKKETAPAKVKKNNNDQSKPSDGRKVMNRAIKTEFDDHTDDSDVQNDHHDKNDQFKCLTCFTLLENKHDLLNHYRKEHTPQDNESENTLERKYSKVKYNDEYRFKCEKCEYMHHIRWFIQRHVKSHTDKRPFNCKICGRTYKSALEIYWHGRAHTAAKWQCFYQCGFTTAYKGALKNHEALHRAEYKYTCDKCNSGFHTRIQLMEHKNKHDGIRPFVCDICGYAFHVRRYLQSHRSRLHPESSSVSSSVKRYLCVHCSLPCETMNALNEHMKAEHEKRTEYLCDLCGKTLTTKEKLSQHKRVHSGVKPFECNICGKKLTRKSHLIIHINGHTKERYFRCRCGKKYIQKSALIRHQRKRCRHYIGKSDRLLELFEAEGAKESDLVDEFLEAKNTVEAKEE